MVEGHYFYSLSFFLNGRGYLKNSRGSTGLCLKANITRNLPDAFYHETLVYSFGETHTHSNLQIYRACVKPSVAAVKGVGVAACAAVAARVGVRIAVLRCAAQSSRRRRLPMLVCVKKGTPQTIPYGFLFKQPKNGLPQENTNSSKEPLPESLPVEKGSANAR